MESFLVLVYGEIGFWKLSKLVVNGSVEGSGDVTKVRLGTFVDVCESFFEVI